MAWLGGAIIFVSVLIPGLRTLSPAASLEFLTKVGPKSTRFFIGAATATVVFGLALFASLQGDYTSGIYVGVALGLIAYAFALAVPVQAFRKAERLAKQMLANPTQGPPPAEFVGAMKRGALGITIVVVILLLAVVFMVASGSGFY